MKKKHLTVETIPKSNINMVERGKSIPQTRQYITAYFPGLVQALQ
jgi:hypothetical protein